MVTLTASAHCGNKDCPWTAAGTTDEVDKAAEKHAKATGHPTATVAEPARVVPADGGAG